MYGMITEESVMFQQKVLMGSNNDCESNETFIMRILFSTYERKR